MSALLGDEGSLESGVRSPEKLVLGILGQPPRMLQQQSGQSRMERSPLSGGRWVEVVAHQAAHGMMLELDILQLEEQVQKKTTQIGLLEHDLAAARAAANRVVALEEQITRLSKSTKKYKGWWKRAVRCVLASGKDWRQVAIAEQAALRICVAERDEAKKALVETTATMNRYFADWKAAVAQVSDAQARVAELEAGKAGWCETDRSNMLLEMSGLRDELSTVKEQLATAEHNYHLSSSSWARTAETLKEYFGTGAPYHAYIQEGQLLADAIPRLVTDFEGMKAELGTQSREGAKGKEGFEQSRVKWSAVEMESAWIEFVKKYSGVAAQIPTPWLQDCLIDFAEAVAARVVATPTSSGADALPLEGGTRGDVDALRARHASDLDALRKNHRNEMAGVQALLLEAERRARHGELMVAALRFDLPEAEVARISRECWELMKASPQLTVDSGQLTAEEKEIHHEGHEAHEEGKEGATTESTEGAEVEKVTVTITPGKPSGVYCSGCGVVAKNGEFMFYSVESKSYSCLACAKAQDEAQPEAKCASCGDELALSERGYITPKGSRYCEPCYDVHLQARLDPCAVKGGAV